MVGREKNSDRLFPKRDSFIVGFLNEVTGFVRNITTSPKRSRHAAFDHSIAQTENGKLKVKTPNLKRVATPLEMGAKSTAIPRSRVSDQLWERLSAPAKVVL